MRVESCAVVNMTLLATKMPLAQSDFK